MLKRAEGIVSLLLEFSSRFETNSRNSGSTKTPEKSGNEDEGRETEDWQVTLHLARSWLSRDRRCQNISFQFISRPILFRFRLLDTAFSAGARVDVVDSLLSWRAAVKDVTDSSTSCTINDGL